MSDLAHPSLQVYEPQVAVRKKPSLQASREVGVERSHEKDSAEAHPVAFLKTGEIIEVGPVLRLRTNPETLTNLSTITLHTNPSP